MILRSLMAVPASPHASARPRCRLAIPVDRPRSRLIAFAGEGDRTAARGPFRPGASGRRGDMHMTRTGRLRTAFVLVVLSGLSGCAGWGGREPLGVTIADLRPLEVGVFEQRYAIKARVLNPNDTEIAFEAVVFDVEINGKPFAKGVSSQGGVVPRFGEALIEITVVSGLQSILRQISELTKGDRTGVTYRVRGRLHSPNIPWPTTFDTTGEFAFPKGSGKPGG